MTFASTLVCITTNFTTHSFFSFCSIPILSSSFTSYLSTSMFPYYCTISFYVFEDQIRSFEFPLPALSMWQLNPLLRSFPSTPPYLFFPLSSGIPLFSFRISSAFKSIGLSDIPPFRHSLFSFSLSLCLLTLSSFRITDYVDLRSPQGSERWQVREEQEGKEN